MTTNKQRAGRYIGNFGIGFFGPLTSGNIANQIFDIGLEFHITLIIAAIASMFQVGFLASTDIKRWSESNGKKKM